MCAHEQNRYVCCATCRLTTTAPATPSPPPPPSPSPSPPPGQCEDDEDCARLLSRHGRRMCYHVGDRCCRSCSPMADESLPGTNETSDEMTASTESSLICISGVTKWELHRSISIIKTETVFVIFLNYYTLWCY